MHVRFRRLHHQFLKKTSSFSLILFQVVEFIELQLLAQRLMRESMQLFSESNANFISIVVVLVRLVRRESFALKSSEFPSDETHVLIIRSI